MRGLGPQCRNVSDSINMEADKIHIRHCLLYEFDLGNNAADAHRKICSVYGENVITERACQQWFQRFRSGEKTLEDQPRLGRPRKLNEQDFIKAIEEDKRVTVAELAEKFKVDRTTVERRMHALGFVTKLDVWVPHELSEKNKENRVSLCTDLLHRQKTEGILRWLVTGDEKWVEYKNVKRRRTVCKKGKAPASTAKENIHPRKVLLCVWWDSHGVIYWEMLPPNQTLTADIYCQQLDRLHEAMQENRPGLVNRHKVIFHRDNARPHTAIIVQQKLMQFHWQVLPHPPYSPDLAPSDFYLFRSLENYLRGKYYDTENNLRCALTQFFSEKDENFYKTGIEKLPIRWQQVVDSCGEYVV